MFYYYSWIDKVRRSRVGKSLLLLISGTALAQLIIALSMPVITRLYSPDMIGVISLYLSFFNFCVSLLSLRYEGALLVAVDDDECSKVLLLCILLVPLQSIFCALVLFLLSKYAVLGLDLLPSSTALFLFLSLLGFGWFMAFRAWLLRVGEVKLLGVSTVTRAFSNVSVRIFLGVLGGGVYGLLLAEIAGSWAALTMVKKKAAFSLGKACSLLSLRELRKTIVKYKRYALFEMPSSLIDQLAIALPVPIIASLYGAQAAGWFGLARLLYAIPNGQIGKAAGDVFFMEFGRHIRNKDKSRGKILFYKFSLYLFFVSLLIFLVSFFIVPLVVPFLFGDEWYKMGEMVALMSPWMLMALIVSSLSRSLSVLQKQHWKLIYDILALLIVLVIYYCSIMNKIELMGFIKFLSFGMAVSYIFYFIVIFLAVRSSCIERLQD